jgi:hypothetical protein
MYATNLLPSLTGMIAFSASAAGTAVSQFAAPETTFATVSVSLLRCCVRPGSNQGLIEMLQATNSRVAGEPQDRFKRTAALRMSLKNRLDYWGSAIRTPPRPRRLSAPEAAMN